MRDSTLFLRAQENTNIYWGLMGKSAHSALGCVRNIMDRNSALAL